jgi:Family of unknown function (DUF5522)
VVEIVCRMSLLLRAHRVNLRARRENRSTVHSTPCSTLYTMDKQKPSPLIEGEHFYFENGYIVFTEKFLKARGYCCKSGCRHCPYGFKKEKIPPQTPEKR